MKKYIYYFTSIFRILVGFCNWPLVFAIFLKLILQRFAATTEGPPAIFADTAWYPLTQLPDLVHQLHDQDFYLLEKVYGRIPVAVAGIFV